ncbi:hypothetical protein L9F63_012962, partial [Diploptera punctata]
FETCYLVNFLFGVLSILFFAFHLFEDVLDVHSLSIHLLPGLPLVLLHSARHTRSGIPACRPERVRVRAPPAQVHLSGLPDRYIEHTFPDKRFAICNKWDRQKKY